MSKWTELLGKDLETLIEGLNAHPECIERAGNVVVTSGFDYDLMNEIICGLKEEWLMDKAILVITDRWNDCVRKNDNRCYVSSGCYSEYFDGDSFRKYDMKMLKYFIIQNTLEAIKEDELKKRKINEIYKERILNANINKVNEIEELQSNENYIENSDIEPVDCCNLLEKYSNVAVKIRAIIEQHALPEIKHKYEWLAVWRAMYDLDVLSKKGYKAFATMINNWFPKAKVSCSADAMGDYSAPYLGETNHEQWNENDFIKQRSAKQSLDGYKSLKRICELLHTQLNAFLNKKIK